MQLDGHETEDGQILRLHAPTEGHTRSSVWVYWPPHYGKVTFYFDNEQDARTVYEALKKVRLHEDGDEEASHEA